MSISTRLFPEASLSSPPRSPLSSPPPRPLANPPVSRLTSWYRFPTPTLRPICHLSLMSRSGRSVEIPHSLSLAQNRRHLSRIVPVRLASLCPQLLPMMNRPHRPPKHMSEPRKILRRFHLDPDHPHALRLDPEAVTEVGVSAADTVDVDEAEAIRRNHYSLAHKESVAA